MHNAKLYNKILFINCSNMTTYEQTNKQTLFEPDYGLGGKFRWIFVVVDVPNPNFGADFLHKFNLAPHQRASHFVNHTQLTSELFA